MDSNNPDDYLVVEDPEKSSTWHLQVSVNGKPDHRLMGAAWAALHEGYRGNVYQGPNKAEALRKLIALYKREKMPIPGEVKSVDDDLIVMMGDEVKALGEGRSGGYLVRFSSPDDPDLAGDYFTRETDFGFGDKDTLTTPVWFHHRLPLRTKSGGEIVIREQIGEGTLRIDDIGVFIEAIDYNRTQYEKAISQRANKLGWSSGTAPHLVDRVKMDNGAYFVKRWPLGLDASKTPTPAEPRNSVMSIKALSEQAFDLELSEEAEQENREPAQIATSNETEPQPSGEIKMSDELLNEVKAAITAQGAKIDALETLIKSAPAQSTVPTGIEVISDPADRPFATLADNFKAIKDFEISRGRTVHPRLNHPAIKASGASEAVPEDGGFLLDPTLVNFVLQPLHETSPLSSMARRLPTSSNYGWINGVDETSRATGSRWGGIRGYRLAEGDQKTASRPKFRRINWELKKYAVLVYATDELLQDKPLFSEVVRTGASEELAFMLNDDIMNGDGAAGPEGILKSAALVTAAAENQQTQDTVVYQNIVNMWSRLLPRSKQSNSTAWFVNSDVMPQLDTLVLTAGTGGIPPRFVNYNDQGVMTIKGKPVYETEFNSTLGDAGDIVLADMAEYLLWEHSAGVQEAISIHVQFITDETVFRLVMRVDGKPSLSSAVTPYKGSNTQSAFVALAGR